MDTLSTIVSTLRVSCALLARARLTAPFAFHYHLGDIACVFQPPATRGKAPGAEPVAVYHSVVSGSGVFRLDGHADWTKLERGDLLVLPRADAHVLADQPSPAAVEFASVVTGAPALPAVVEAGGGGDELRTLCGTFRMEQDTADAVFSLMPAVVHVRGAARSGCADVSALLDRELQRAEAGSGAVVQRLSEVLFFEALRACVGDATGSSGWLAAAKDAQIGRALALFHAAPERRWSAATLARQVGMSRSRFFERFTELMGEGPASYLARERVRLAEQLMLRSPMSTARLAELVGYSSEAAFVRAFKRHRGVSPSQLRRAERR